MVWHTKQEKRILKRLGGKPHPSGYDGTIKGKPVEIRSSRTDKRYRIQKDVHRHLVDNDGYYIFVDNGVTRKVSAERVSELIGRGKWYKDRNYPHKFLLKKLIFRKKIILKKAIAKYKNR